MSHLTETLPGLWSWETPHPDWAPGDSWPAQVRSWALADPAGLILIDPLIGAEEWDQLDALSHGSGGVQAIIRTLHFHQRSITEAAARYGAPVYARPVPRPEVPAHPHDVSVGDGQVLPGGVVAHALGRDDELALWLPTQRALVFSDVGQTRAGRFELCPGWWVHPPDSWPHLLGQLSALARVGPEQLLVSHGDQLGDVGTAALEAAIARVLAEPMAPFIDLDTLAHTREHAKLVDVRFYMDGRSGAAAYEAAHLPGAVYVELEDVLSDPPGADARRGRHPLPSPERFAAGLAAAGISDTDAVVAYDDAGGVIAARLVWLLRVTGHDAAVLHPVPAAHLEAVPVEAPAPGHFTPRPWPTELIASIDEVAERDRSTVLLDARDPARFAGGPDPADPPGHIPGAVNLPCRENVGLSAAELRARFIAAGIEPRTEVISSCGSGVTACHNLLSLEHAGLGQGRLYPGSWSEWSRDPSRPRATGSHP